ncbi:MAG: hypothetical protein MPL62_13215 [Alphaproteobacteria bacterium]|nr:hypothetical protein [Alphaproteobacteria bacterium]
MALVIHGAGFFFTRTVLNGACESSTSKNSVLKMLTLSSGQSKMSMMDQGAVDRSASKVDLEKFLKDRRVTMDGGGFEIPHSMSSKIGR